MCESCESCIRVLMIIFNILFTIVGLTVLAAGLYFYFSTFGLRTLEHRNILAYTYIVIAIIGSLSIVLGILGCCGSYHYSRCLLGFYFVILLVIFAAEVAVGVAGFVYKDQVRDLIHLNVKEGVEDLKNAPSGEFRWMDTIQLMFQCCGYNGQLDYGIVPPNSCCKNMECSAKDIIPLFTVGCKGRIEEIMRNHFILCVVIISIAIIELVGLIFAMTLCCAARGREVGYYPAVRA